MSKMTSIAVISCACFISGFFISLLVVAPFVGVRFFKSAIGIAADVRGS